jgi:hypothetical protein
MPPATLSLVFEISLAISLGVFLTDLLETGFTASFVFLPLLLQPRAFYFPIFVDALTLLAAAYFFLLVALFPFFALALLFFLPGLLASLVGFLLPPSALVFLGALFPFSLAILLELLLPYGLSLLTSSVRFLCPFLLSLASSFFLHGSGFGADFKTSIFPHLR